MIVEALERELARAGVAREDFERVVQRLLSKQVVYRDPENKTERDHYDTFVRISDVVSEYLSGIGLDVVEPPGQEFVIVYPPGADYPYDHDVDERERALTARMRKEETGLMLVCRKLYEDAAREGDLDEAGEAFVSLEHVYATYEMLVRESIPAVEARRREIFKRLKDIRVLQYRELSSEDDVIRIRPTVAAFTMQGFVDALAEVTGDAAGGLDQIDDDGEEE